MERDLQLLTADTHLTDSQEQNALEEFPSYSDVKSISPDGHTTCQSRNNYGKSIAFLSCGVICEFQLHSL